jgi:hypothetical protein
MTLRDLEATFIQRTDDGWRHVDAIAKADGLHFLCPKCFRDNKGAIGTHVIVCWSPKIAAGMGHGIEPGRWYLRGNSLDDLSLVAGSSSGAHFFVTNGAIDRLAA